MTTTEHNNKSKRITPTGRHKLKANEQHTAPIYSFLFNFFSFYLFLVTAAAAIARTSPLKRINVKKSSKKRKRARQQLVSEKKSQAVFLLTCMVFTIRHSYRAWKSTQCTKEKREAHTRSVCARAHAYVQTEKHWLRESEHCMVVRIIVWSLCRVTFLNYIPFIRSALFMPVHRMHQIV